MRSSLIKTSSQRTIGIHTLRLRCTCVCNPMSEVILKLSLDIDVRDPGFDIGSHHVGRAGRAVCGGKPNQKAKVLSEERTFFL